MAIARILPLQFNALTQATIAFAERGSRFE